MPEVIFTGPAGRLEGRFQPAKRKNGPIAIILHPHPQFGGTMNNQIVYDLFYKFQERGFTTLRFNFRGVGTSEGSFDNGEGEVADALAAVAWMRSELPDLPLWLSGFSFGAAMAIRASVISKPSGLVSIAPAVSRFAGNLETQPDCPWLILQGDQDELVDIEETVAWVNELEPGPELEIFPETEHFFHGKLTLLRNAVEEFVRENQRNFETNS